MGLFDKIFGKKVTPMPTQQTIPNKEPEHAVIIRFNYGVEELDDLHRLEDKLRNIIDNNVGEYDGHEIATDYSDGVLYMYGPNAEDLFKTIKPILDGTSFMKGAIVKLRFGPPADGVKEIEIEL